MKAWIRRLLHIYSPSEHSILDGIKLLEDTRRGWERGMTLFPDWQNKHKDEISYPVRLTELHRLYGKTDGQTCKDCVHLIRYKMGGRWMKCELSKRTNSSATDWKAGWPACGKFEKGGEE